MFDGDEMNIFLAQSIQARNELKRIANVKYQIVSVKNSSPIIGCQQDTLSGAYMLTEPSVRMKGWEVANILCNTTSETKLDIKMNKEYTGHEIFSHIIPTGINNIKKSGDKIILEIIDGKLKSGYLDKSALSFAKNSIIHFIWDKWGPNKTRRFIDDSQRLVLNYLLTRGQTVGFKDILVDEDIKNKMQQIVNNDILKSKYNITQYENENDELSLDIIEDSLNNELIISKPNIGKILMSYYKIDNFFWTSAISGAKGDMNNVAQINGVIGQQNIEGVRLRKRVENRSMIYFHKDDDTPEARGYIKNSYLSGLRGYEFFVNAAAGREGLIDTAIRTAQTGYIQRQLIKGLEDLTIKYDGTNRNARGTIIQSIYGENGINQSTQTEIILNILKMDNKTLEEKLGFSDSQIKKLKFPKMKEFNSKFIDKLKKFRDELRQIQANAVINFKFVEEKFVVPVNLYRITQAYTTDKAHNDLNPEYIEESIEKFLTDYDNRLITTLKPTDKFMKQDDRNVKFLLEVALNEYLAPIKCIFEYNLSKKSFDEMMQEIKLVFIKSIIEPGEMVGIIAAQSIGEPTSQLTLNTKHSAGSATKSAINSGVSRIQELLHYSKNIKTPQTAIYFNEPYCFDRAAINKIASYFKYLSIRYLIATAEIYYDVGINDELGKKLKSDNVSNPFFVNNQKVEVGSLPFVFRLKMDMEKMLDKETTLLDIKTKFISHWYKYYTNIKNLKKNEKEVIGKISRCAILSNNLNDKEQIIHIRFNMSAFNYNLVTEFFRMVFDDIPLKGIDNITNIDIVQETCIKFDEKTGAIKNNEKEYVVYTAGINIERMRQIKNIDFTRSKCNDIATTLRLYGIEAARQIIIHELLLAFSSSAINHNHLSVLIDQMCHLGEIVSIDRHGLSKIATDPITRASFEKTMDHFINAALFNEKDYLNSISSQIAVGQGIKAGTGIFELLLDTKKIENSEYTEDETGGRITFNPLDEEPLLQDIIKYSLGKTDFFIPK